MSSTTTTWRKFDTGIIIIMTWLLWFPFAHAGDAVLSLYRQEPGIRLTNDDGTFTCPLTWWKFNEK